jgi:hypothetical protein
MRRVTCVCTCNIFTSPFTVPDPWQHRRAFPHPPTCCIQHLQDLPLNTPLYLTTILRTVCPTSSGEKNGTSPSYLPPTTPVPTTFLHHSPSLNCKPPTMSGSGSGSMGPPKPPPRKKSTAAFKKGLAKITNNEERVKELRADALESRFFDSSSSQTREFPSKNMSIPQLHLV